VCGNGPGSLMQGDNLFISIDIHVVKYPILAISYQSDFFVGRGSVFLDPIGFPDCDSF
jgi:hypothetical protein